VLILILWGGVRLVLIGLIAGIPIAGLAAQGLTALLFGIEPLDPATFLGIPLLLIGITIAATLNPARRAAGISPVQALHHE
jgi:putative ABC transport system permease protein